MVYRDRCLQSSAFPQCSESTFDQARAELETGQKRSHWMWFIFPQIKGLGSSATAQRFAISSLDEGAAYLEHRVLERRLEACTALVLAVEASQSMTSSAIPTISNSTPRSRGSLR